jgi:hypothetical protein
MANINNEVKELEKLFGWWEFYEQTQNDEAKNKAQKQIESQRKDQIYQRWKNSKSS